MKNDICIRLEQKKDYSEVENLVREAFWNVYRPGCTEHFLIHVLRDDPDFIPELDYVMEKDGKLIGNDIVIFRYADVLLMKAEALVRNGEDGTALVNMVRARAGAKPLERVTLGDILRERMIEFSWEGLRRQDLVRFGEFTRSWSSRPALPGESSGYTTVFPIPADVLALNPKLSQNPGY